MAKTKAQKPKAKAKKITLETIVKHEAKKRLVKEMARTQEWFPADATVVFGKKHGGKTIEVQAMQNEKRYPGLMYAPTEDKKFVIFHSKSGKVVFYNVANEPLARKLLKQTVSGIKSRGLGWDAEESEIMDPKNVGTYSAVVRKVKQQNSTKQRGKWD